MTDKRNYVDTITEQALATVRTTQAAAVNSVGLWAQAAHTLTSRAPLPKAASWSERLPQPSAVVDDVYDAFEKVIANQREFGHQLVAAAAPVAAPAPAPKKK
jgi:hypothetical protein